MAVVTKIDLADAVEFDRSAARANIQSVRPGMPVMELSAKTGCGMDAWMRWLALQREQGSSVPTHRPRTD